MKRLLEILTKWLLLPLLLAQLIITIAGGLVFADFPGSPISGGGGGSGTTNADDLTSGTVDAARGGTNLDTSGSTGFPKVSSGTWSVEAASTHRASIGLGSSDNVTFGTVSASEFISTAADNTRGATVPNTADPTGANLADGKCWYNTTDEAWKCRGLDNTASVTMSQVYKYYRANIDATDNVVFDGPIPFAQIWDNVLFLVQDNTGKLSGAATDNVTVNLSYCSSIATPTCTDVFSSYQVPTGAAILTPALNNSTPSANDYIRVTYTAANMTNKRLYIRVRYRE